MRTTTQNLILAMFLGLAVLLLNSCASISGYGGNPAPDMKTLHMATMHDGYTKEDKHQHPDYDCDQDDTPYVLISAR